MWAVTLMLVAASTAAWAAPAYPDRRKCLHIQDKEPAVSSACCMSLPCSSDDPMSLTKTKKRIGLRMEP
ncbi:hypothetical protein J6590_045579 [Homalodisca vitripennis]|nr:hypothetical protein J6590_045579 [Homalodisca vitripennis]